MLASYLDSTNLKPDCSRKDIIGLCERAAEFGMAAVCINPARVSLAAQVLDGSEVRLAAVIGFPLGATPAGNKLQEAGQALKEGANELDMVINLGAVKDRDYKLVSEEIKLLLQMRKDHDYQLKVIVETALLSREELQMLTVLASDLGADYIKTSTGFAGRGATIEDIEAINLVKSNELKIKASGGIKTVDFALCLIQAGVHRIGSSSAEELVNAYRQGGK